MSNDLEQIQRWMQAVITHPRGIVAGMESSAARQSVDLGSSDVEQVISRSQALDSVRRLEIYGNAYYARLIECLVSEFPAVHAAVGEVGFRGLAFGYLQHFPSKSYTLSELGRAFPQFLTETRPPRTGASPDWADFLIDLATLERTYSEVFDGPGEEGQRLMTADYMLAIPPKRWSDIRLRTARSLRLLELRFPVQEYAAAVRRKETPSLPAPAATQLAVNRREYVVRRRSLSPLPYHLLQQLQQGSTLGAAIEATVPGNAVHRPEFPTLIREWFRLWTRDGYFVGVEM